MKNLQDSWEDFNESSPKMQKFGVAYNFSSDCNSGLIPSLQPKQTELLLEWKTLICTFYLCTSEPQILKTGSKANHLSQSNKKHQNDILSRHQKSYSKHFWKAKPWDNIKREQKNLLLSVHLQAVSGFSVFISLHTSKKPLWINSQCEIWHLCCCAVNSQLCHSYGR